MRASEWSTVWDVMCGRFGRDPDPDLATFYLEQLEARLSDVEIRRGVERVLYSNTYWPSPREIVEAGSGEDASREAEREWRRVLEMKDRRGRTPDEERPSPAALRALRQIGGMEALRDAKPSNVIRFRRAFLEAYEALRPQDPLPALPRGGDGDDDEGVRRLTAAGSSFAEAGAGGVS